MTTTYVGLIKENKTIEGFNCKPGFGIFYDSDGKLAFSSGWESGGQIMVYHRTPNGWQRLAPPVYTKCTDVVPGNRCNNGGEYGFYSHYEPTDTPGVFWSWTTTTCDFDRCGTPGYEAGEYVVLTKKRMRRLMQISGRIEEEGDLYNPS